MTEKPGICTNPQKIDKTKNLVPHFDFKLKWGFVI